MAIRVILDITARDETREEIIQILREELHTTRKYAGNEGVELITNQESPNNVVLYEMWQTLEHYQAYYAWRVETGFSEQFRALFAEPPNVRKLEVVEIY